MVVQDGRAPTVIYDGDCGFCRSCVDVMQRRIRPRATAVAWQECDVVTMGLTAQQCSAALQFVSVSGDVSSGSRAVMAMLRTSRAPWTWMGAVGDAPGIAWVADVIYRTVAANRGTISRVARTRSVWTRSVRSARSLRSARSVRNEGARQ